MGRQKGSSKFTRLDCTCKGEHNFMTTIYLKDFIYYENGLKCANLIKREYPSAEYIDTQCQNTLKIKQEKRRTYHNDNGYAYYSNTYFAWLQGTCKINGKSQKINMDIKGCMGNLNGHFSLKEKNFINSAKECEVNFSKGIFFLDCILHTADGKAIKAFTPLSAYVVFDE